MDLRFHDVFKPDKRNVTQLFCSVSASLCKAGLGEEEKVLPAVGEQIASHDQRFEHAQIDGFVCPLAFGE